MSAFNFTRNGKTLPLLALAGLGLAFCLASPAAQAASAMITFVGTDSTTRGNWETAGPNGTNAGTYQYGTDGWWLLKDAGGDFYNQLPPGVTITVGSSVNYNAWSGTYSSAGDDMQVPYNSSATFESIIRFYTGTGNTLEVNTHGRMEKVSMYCADYQNLGRVGTVTATGTGATTDGPRTVSNFYRPSVYLSYVIQGDITFNIQLLQNSNMCITGLLFDFIGAPAANPQTVAAAPNATITLSGTDTSGSTLTATIVTLPTAGTLYQTPDGVTLGAAIAQVPTTVKDSLFRVIFTPVAGQGGTPYASFGWTLSDAYGQVSAPATVTINAAGTHNAPAATPEEVTTGEGAALTVTLSGTDADPVISASIVTLPAIGALYQYSNGAQGTPITALPTAVTDSSLRVIYVPNPVGSGNSYATFGFTVATAYKTSAPAAVVVDVTASGNTWTWTGAGTNNNWSTPGNWDQGTAPSATNEVYFNSATAPCTIDGPVTCAGIYITPLYTGTISGSSIANATVQVNGNFSQYGGTFQTALGHVGDVTVTGNLLVSTGTTFIVRYSSLAGNGFGQNVQAATATINGSMNADGQGFSSGPGSGSSAGAIYNNGWEGTGASYGGTGGYVVTHCYGSFQTPTALGSGGNIGGAYGLGGGAIVLSVANSLTVNGTLSANGGLLGTGTGQASGTGGSLCISANVLSGAGFVLANASHTTSGQIAGCAGGRISLANVTNMSGFNGTLQAYGDTPTYQNIYARGYTGTICPPANFNLVLGGAGNMASLKLGTDDTPNVYSFNSITINSGGTLYLDGNPNQNVVNGVTCGLTAQLVVTGTVNVLAGGLISATGLGFDRGSGPGSAGAWTNGNYSGASHGGSGDALLPCYGSLTNPIELGSGGCAGNNTEGGGGAVCISAAAVMVNGSITADGVTNTYDPGSGGSVNILAGTFSGAGLITANGVGNYGTPHGNSGGGRIAIKLSAGNSFGTCAFHAYTGWVSAYNETTLGYAAAGSVYLETQQNGPNNGQLIIDDSTFAEVNSAYTHISTFCTGTSVGSVTVQNNAILSIDPGVSLTATGAITIASSNARTLNSGTINVGGNWSNTGTVGAYTDTIGSVILTGGSQAISGTTTFNNLSKTVSAPASTLTFQNGSTTTVNGILTLQGASGNLLALRSDATGHQWKIAPAAKAISYVDVEDSNNITATRLDPPYSVNSGNDTNWFPPAPGGLAVAPSPCTTPANTNVLITLSTTDASNDLLAAYIVSVPAQGMLYQTTDGVTANTIFPITAGEQIYYSNNSLGTSVAVVFVPGPGSGSPYATFSFQFTNLTLGNLSSAVMTVPIEVTASNVYPQANAGAVTNNEASAFAVTLTGTDADGSSLFATIVNLPLIGNLYQTSDGSTSNGTLIGSGQQVSFGTGLSNPASFTVIYVPPPVGFGTPFTTFAFTLTSGTSHLTSPPVTVAIGLNHVYLVPTALAPVPALMTLHDTNVALTLSGTDSNGDPLIAATIVTLPLQGTLYQTLDGVTANGAAITTVPAVVTCPSSFTVIFVPLPGTYGNPYATFGFTVGNGGQTSSPVSVPITVAEGWTWTGAGENSSWSNGANWDLGSMPTTDLAIFNTTSVANCTMDVPVSVGGIVILSGYTGTITATGVVTAGNWTQSAGAFQTAQGVNGTVTVPGTLLVDTGATFIVRYSSLSANGNQGFGQVIQAGTALINGSLNADGQGFLWGPGSGSNMGLGASYGGTGGGHTVSQCYGSFQNPTALGSGEYFYGDGIGGGAIILSVANTLTVNGTLSAMGGFGAAYGNGGTGGSLNLSANVLNGTGSILANASYSTANMHSNAGGRISLANVTNLSGFSGVLQASGALGNNWNRYRGYTGTICFPSNFDLVLGGAGNMATLTLGTDDTPNIYSFNSITINSGGALYIDGNPNANTVNGVTCGAAAQLAVSGTVTVNQGGLISATGNGFQFCFGPGSTAVYPGVNAGASHGGSGDVLLPCYGSLTNPTELGSGGPYNGPGGLNASFIFASDYGGGAVCISALSVIVNGSITADGMSQYAYAAGAGGSVNIVAGTFSSTSSGVVSANGAYYYSTRGCSGGGRIAVKLSAGNSFGAGSFQAHGGSFNGTTRAAAGTIYLETQQDGSNHGQLAVSNNNLTWSGAATTLISSQVSDTAVGSVSLTGNAQVVLDASQTLTLLINPALGANPQVALAGGAQFTLNNALTVPGNVSLASGAVLLHNNLLNLGGNWSNSGGSITGSGTLNLTGNSQTISGDTTFVNLVDTVPGATLSFTNGTTQTVSGALTLLGSSNQWLSLQSSAPGSSWNLNPQGSRSVQFVSVRDSDNINPTAIQALNSANLGNNINWIFSYSEQTPLALAQNVTGAADAPLLITLSGTDVNPADSVFTAAIVTLPLNGTLYQTPDGSTLGSAVTAIGQVVASGSLQVIYKPLSTGFGSPYDSFGFVISDGAATSSPATITVNVTPPLLGITWAAGTAGKSEGDTAAYNWALGTLAPGAVRSTDPSGSDAAQTFVVRNTGNVLEQFVVTCGNSASWTLAETAGFGLFEMGVSDTTGSSYTPLAAGGVAITGAGVPLNGIQAFYLRFKAPTGAASGSAGIPQSIPITLMASPQP